MDTEIGGWTGGMMGGDDVGRCIFEPLTNLRSIVWGDGGG